MTTGMIIEHSHIAVLSQSTFVGNRHKNCKL